MKILLRNQQTSDDGIAKYRDEPLANHQVSIGRNPNQQIHCAAPEIEPRHAVIIFDENEQPYLESRGRQRVDVNGSLVGRSSLAVGDKINVGEVTITVIEAPEGYAGALSIERAALASAGVAVPSDLPMTARLGRRSWSWMLFCAILLAFLALPSLVLMDAFDGDQVRELPLPDDSVWLPGPLHSAHAFEGHDCQVCHVRPFLQVQDVACRECHSDVSEHADVNKFPMSGIDGSGCTDCHSEHKEPLHLVNGQDQLCSDCHQKLDVTHDHTEIRNVSNFNKRHPGFSITLMPTSGGIHQPEDLDKRQFEVHRVPLDSPELQEASGLQFSHAVHMDPEGIVGPNEQEVLACNDCHQPERGGKLMRPINMERDCQRCHQLEFTAMSNRQAPHATPHEVMLYLGEYYAMAALHDEQEPDADLPPDTAPRVRPGAPELITPEARKAAMKEVHGVVRQAADRLFTNDADNCALCHEVKQLENDHEGMPRWQVAPISISQHWLPMARFDHGSHSTMACEDCHAATVSEVSQNVLIPNIDNCRQCHEPEGAGANCITCHKFHSPHSELMRHEHDEDE